VRGRFKLDPAWSVSGALRNVARYSLARLESGGRGVLLTDHTRFVHRARTALRRLRVALKLLGRTDDTAWKLRARLKRVMRVLGDARDWDVFLDHTLPPVVRAFGKTATVDGLVREARRGRLAAHAKARKTLSSPRYRDLISQLARWLHRKAESRQSSGSLRKFAARSIRKRHRHLLRDRRHFAAQSPPQHHRVRIDAKKLRYTVEIFESLFPRKSVRPYLRELVAIQDALGSVNDTNVAARLIALLRPGAEFSSFAHSWLALREEQSSADAQATLGRLDRCKPFWKV
jgi:triphosphatase